MREYLALSAETLTDEDKIDEFVQASYRFVSGQGQSARRAGATGFVGRADRLISKDETTGPATRRNRRKLSTLHLPAGASGATAVTSMTHIVLGWSAFFASILVAPTEC